MRTILAICMVGAMVFSHVSAEDLTFKKTKIVVLKGEKQKQVPVIVNWTDDKVTIMLKKASDTIKYPNVNREIPYANMKKMSYEYSKHWRVASAIRLTPWTLFSRRKHHWFTIEYTDAEGNGQATVLRLDKKEERRTLPSKNSVELVELIDD